MLTAHMHALLQQGFEYADAFSHMCTTKQPHDKEKTKQQVKVLMIIGPRMGNTVHTVHKTSVQFVFCACTQLACSVYSHEITSCSSCELPSMRTLSKLPQSSLWHFCTTISGYLSSIA